MESQQEQSLFSWLDTGNIQAIEWQGLKVCSYAEAHYSPEANRVRIVYEPTQDAKAAIEIGLADIGQDFSLCQIQRESRLACVEVSLSAPMTVKTRDYFQQVKGVECFVIKQPLPMLNLPGLLVMDMDSTAIQIECIDELASLAGVGEEVAQVTELAMQGELDFEQSLRQRVAKLAGAEASIIGRLCDSLPLTPGLAATISELKSHGWRTVVASGGFTPFVEHLKGLLDLDAAFANELVISKNILVGEVSGEVVDAQFKADVVKKCAELWHIPEGQRLAIGDGANDIPMLQQADFGLAFHAKPKLSAIAQQHIAHLDLSCLPYLLQGA